MSRAFEGLGFVAAIVFVLIVIGRLITGGAQGLAEFIEKYYVIIGIVLLLVIAAICCFVLNTIDGLPVGNKVINSIASGFALAQNAGFLVYGLYRALTAYANDAFLIILGIGGFILVYIIDTTITAAGISLSKDKPWSPVVTLLIAILGLSLILEW